MEKWQLKGKEGEDQTPCTYEVHYILKVSLTGHIYQEAKEGEGWQDMKHVSKVKKITSDYTQRAATKN